MDNLYVPDDDNFYYEEEYKVPPYPIVMKHKNTWLTYVNYIIQVLFIKLTRCEERTVTSFKIHSASRTDKGYSVNGGIQEGYTARWYSIQLFIVPFTGWINGFKYIGTPYFFRITPKFKIDGLN